MEKTYDSFIELTPGYESVVDISSDSRDAEFWRRYIVNEDMVSAVKLLAKSLRPDDLNEDVKHYWIKGTYGTGKTYSAIVIKHLLQDDYDIVNKFLSKNSLFPDDVKDKFLSARRKGKYYVQFRSGECKQLNTSNKFLFQIEQSVRDLLKDNNFKYTGRNSLIEAVQKKVKEFRPKLAVDFDDDAYPEFWSTYDSFDQFYNAVLSGDVKACSDAQDILQSMNIGLATDLDTFKEWIKDVYDGNVELKKTGMFIIWDEFTEYIRYNDLDIIQQLSLFAKELPFFVIYVIHEYPGVFSENVSAGLGKADARFHKIDISLSDKTAFKLIGESIIPCSGMKDNWSEICDELYSSISDSAHIYLGDPDSDLDANALKKIFPIHPMTVNLVSKVADNAASNRSIFEFLKSSGDDGFREYIKNNGPYGWKWVTPDYLWDYFFVNNLGGKKDLSKTAEDALSHYNKVYDKIPDNRILRVFKGAMLLLATVGSGHSLRKSNSKKGIRSTEKTLHNCFAGMLDKTEVSKCLQVLSTSPLNVLVLTTDQHEISRIELPYSGTSGELASEIEKIRTNNSLVKLFNADSDFGSKLKEQFVPKEKAVVKRLEVDTCWGATQNINSRFAELKKTVGKTYHKFGMLIVAVQNIEDIEKIKRNVMELLASDDTKRLIVCILRHPLPESDLKTWYELVATASMAQRGNKTGNATSLNSQADDLINKWVSTAIGKDIDILYGNTSSYVTTNRAVISAYEKIVFNIFPAAPERFIKLSTLYQSAGKLDAYFGVSKITNATKNPANDKEKNFNKQWEACVTALSDKVENVWDCNSIEEVMSMGETNVGKSMAALCSIINKELTSGSVQLTDLWDRISKELGYYDTHACCYLIGFALHFYIGKFTWYDGNNSHKFDEDTVPTLIYDMLKGKASGMKLSSESVNEKRFKDVTIKIFNLSLDDVGDVFDCRKYVKVEITKNGCPIWAIKYLGDAEFSGIKQEISKIIDLYVDFILELGNQSEVLEQIVTLIGDNPNVYINTLNTLFRDKDKLNIGMMNYIFENSPETKDACDKYGFPMKTLFTMFTKELEEEKWQWREDEVVNAADKLTLDLTLVGVVNNVLGGSAESVEKIRDTLSNYLNYIRIPGCVYASLQDDWAETVETLHELSINKWVTYDRDEKIAVIKELEYYMKDAIYNIQNPLSVLKTYIDRNNMGSFSDSEYNDILRVLHKEPFDQSEPNFRSNISKKIKALAYSKKVNQLLAVWKEKTGVENVSEWTTTHIMPIIWVMPDCENIFSVIFALEKNERIDEGRLNNVITAIDNADFSVLSDQHEIDRKFIVNVASEKYLTILLPHVVNLKKYIQDNGYRDYTKWNNDPGKIRTIAEKYMQTVLRSEISDKAKERVNKINSLDQLKKQLEKILENSSEACLLLLDEE